MRDEKMEAIRGPTEAEVRAREFIRDRHPRVRQILFRRVHGEGDFWLVDGEVWFKRAYFHRQEIFQAPDELGDREAHVL